jgi:hypothetical protein
MGRKRLYPEGATNTDRANASLAVLIQSGGARRTFRLSKEANSALKSIAKSLNLDNDTAAAEYAFLSIAAQLRVDHKLSAIRVRAAKADVGKDIRSAEKTA